MISSTSPRPPLLSSQHPPNNPFCLSFSPALRSSFKALEASLPKMEDLQGAAKALMRLQDVYALQVGSLTRGRFQRAARGDPVDIYRPAVSVPLSGDDCFLVPQCLWPYMSHTGKQSNTFPFDLSVELYLRESSLWLCSCNNSLNLLSEEGAAETFLPSLEYSHCESHCLWEGVMYEGRAL